MGTADGFFPVVCRWWEPTVELLEASGLPWPEESAMIDLRWWEDYVRMKAHEGVRLPSERALSIRWRWSRRQVRNLLDDRDLWVDPDLERGGPPADHPRATSGPLRNGSKPRIRSKRTRGGPPSDQDRTGLSTFRHRSTGGSAGARSRGADQIELDLDIEPADPPAQDDPSPSWAKTWTKSAKLEATPLEVYGGVNRALEAIRQKVRLPSESAARPVLRLWTEILAVGTASTVDELVDVVSLIAHACRECPDPIFRNDVKGIRADGEVWKKDTSKTPSSVCRLAAKKDSEGASWDGRLEVAEEWRDAGFPIAPSGPAPRRGPPGRRSAASRFLENMKETPE